MEVAPGVHRLGSPHVNYYLVEDDQGRSLTLVDGGMPAHWSQLRATLQRLGRTPSDVAAVVLTHSHVDHVGFSERLRRSGGARVWAHAADADRTARTFPPLHLYLLPTSWPFLLEALRGRLI